MSLAESYGKEIRKEIKRYANWEPGRPLELGDFGVLNGPLFERLGNLRDLKVAFDTRADPSGKTVAYSSKNAVQMEAGAGASVNVGPVANAKAALKITFGREHSVVFNAVGVTYDSVSDQVDLQRKLLQAIEAETWDARWSVVTELMRSKSTTVVVSTGSNGSILLEAKGDVPKVDLADADIRLSVKSERNIGYRAITEGEMTPLMALSRIRPRGLFWWRRTELRRDLGFLPGHRGRGHRYGPARVSSRLDDNMDSLVDELRAGRAPAKEAFEWAELQPSARPGGG